MRLYFHIPFCHRKCSYCDFYFTTQIKHQSRFVKALYTELDLRKREWQNKAIRSIYFGGGTPSYLKTGYLEEILNHLFQHAKIPVNAEITLEANPEDINPDTLRSWKNAGINRLSIGIQSFDDGILKLLNRNHNSKTAIQSIELARRYGFDNINIDLIFGIPGMTSEHWQKQLETFLQLDIPHLSAYALSIESKTLLQYQIKKNILRLTPDECYERQFKLTRQMLLSEAYLHYEISNYAHPGKEARHNTAYWQGEPYAGFGPAAHSFNGKNLRKFNPPNIHSYMKYMEKHENFEKFEVLKPRELYNEYLITRFRHLVAGVPEAEIARKFPEFFDYFINQARKLAHQGLLKKENGRWLLAEAALFTSDNILTQLIY